MFEGGGNGHVFGLNGLLRFAELYTLNFEFNKSLSVEPNADWIEGDEIIRGKSILLDGEKNKGMLRSFL